MLLSRIALGLILVAEPPAPEGDARRREGETVAAISMEAPEKDRDRLMKFVELKPGDAFRGAVVRHAVELLYATGEFEDVVVESKASPAGLELVFRPRPAPLLRQVLVEGDRILKPGEVRDLARLRAGEPLWPSRLDTAARDVGLALAEDGYLEARVTPEARLRADGAAAVFSVHAGPRVRVGTATIEGTETALLQDLVEPRPGHVFERRRVQRAAEEMRKRLSDRGHWRAAVDPPLGSYDPAAGRMALVFKVEPGPPISVEFQGASPSAALRRRVERLLREGAAKTDVQEEAADLLDEEFRTCGHRNVEVSHQEETRPTGFAIVYTIHPGPVAQVASVRLVGEGASDFEGSLITRHGSPLQDRTLDEDVRAVRRALEDQGFTGTQVEAEAPEGGGLIPVTFRIRPGPRTLVRSILVEAPEPRPREVQALQLRLRTDEPYRVRDLAEDRANLLSAYHNAGFLRAEVTPAVAFSEDRTEARVKLKVAPGPRTDVDHIVISGLEVTRPEVVRRELLVHEGDPLGLKNVLESQRRLSALGLFDRLSISEMDPESTEKRSLVVAASEAPRTTLAYGLGYGELDKVRGSFEVTKRNLLGMDRTLSALARASFQGGRLLATFREPFLLGHRQELLVTGFGERENRENYDFVRAGGLLQTDRALSPSWSLILRYSYQRTRTLNAKVPCQEFDRQFCSAAFSGPSASIVNDTRDDPVNPRGGHFLGADLQLSLASLGGDSFLKGFLRASAYRRLGDRVVLALNGQIGLAQRTRRDEEPSLPYPDRFYAGGDYSLRGFRQDTVGPQQVGSDGSLVPTGGNALVLAGSEIRIDLKGSFSLAVFSDVGNVYPFVSNLDLHDLRYSAGLGLRYKSAFGPLRIDWGYKLNRRTGESPSHLHVTVGHAF